MQRLSWRVYFGLLFAFGCLAQKGGTERAFSRQEIEAIFNGNNPALLARRAEVDEAGDEQITAGFAASPRNLVVGSEVIQ